LQSADSIEYDEAGTGPTLVLVPGSLSTGAAWKQIANALGNGFRIVATSLLGNGRTAERRAPGRTSIQLQADALEAVVRRAGDGPVHLVSHSYGGVAVLALALRKSLAISSMVLIEPNPADVLRRSGEFDLYAEFHAMSSAYAQALARDEAEAVARVVDFYDGPGTFAALPARVRAYLASHAASNVLDWASMYGFDPALVAYATVNPPTLIVRGLRGHRGMHRIAEVLHAHLADATLVSIPDAGHFMLATHAAQLAQLIADQVTRIEATHPVHFATTDIRLEP